jgi:hypothetical protein
MSNGMTYVTAAYGLTVLSLAGYAFRLIRRGIVCRAKLGQATPTREDRAGSRIRDARPGRVPEEVTHA